MRIWKGNILTDGGSIGDRKDVGGVGRENVWSDVREARHYQQIVQA